jgi:hypothetical protein
MVCFTLYEKYVKLLVIVLWNFVSIGLFAEFYKNI